MVPVGTAPHHVWLTTFGAAAMVAGPPEPWSEDPAGLQATAALSELWLGVRDHGYQVGLYLAGWSRLQGGLTWHDPGSDTVKQLPVESELRICLGREVVTALVVARVERVPTVRVAVGVFEPRPAGLVSRAVWRTPFAPDEAPRLVAVLGGTLAGGR